MEVNAIRDERNIRAQHSSNYDTLQIYIFIERDTQSNRLARRVPKHVPVCDRSFCFSIRIIGHVNLCLFFVVCSLEIVSLNVNTMQCFDQSANGGHSSFFPYLSFKMNICNNKQQKIRNSIEIKLRYIDLYLITIESIKTLVHLSPFASAIFSLL